MFGERAVLRGGQRGARRAQRSRVRVDLDAGLPFPDMTFILVPQDPKYAPHTPHPIAVTQAELDAGTSKAGVVTYTRRTPVG